MVKASVKTVSKAKNVKAVPKEKSTTPAATKTDKKQTVKPATSITNKTRHFYVYYKGNKLEHTRLSGKRPKQAANKALTSIIKFEKSKGEDVIEKEIKFYIVETGRKKWKEKKVGQKTKKVMIIKRKFYYVGKKVHIPTDLTSDYYKNKKIIKVDLEQDANGKIIKINKEEVISDGKGREIRVILNNNKVDALLISKKETTKTTKDGKIIKIPATHVIHKYINVVNRDKNPPKEEKPVEPKQKKETKTAKKQVKKDTKKKTTTKSPKKTSTKKTPPKKTPAKKSPKKTK